MVVDLKCRRLWLRMEESTFGITHHSDLTTVVRSYLVHTYIGSGIWKVVEMVRCERADREEQRV